MKVWNTRYALTQGILVHEHAEHDSRWPHVVKVRYACGTPAYLQGRDWHTTEEAAVARAEQMREKKLTSLLTQLDNIRAIRFEPTLVMPTRKRGAV
jgi:hypothetical protein